MFVYRTQQIHIKAGQHHHLKIVPIRHFATSTFKELSRETRECQLREEIDNSSIFRHYSQKGCIHECILRNMVSYIHICHLICGILRGNRVFLASRSRLAARYITQPSPHLKGQICSKIGLLVKN